MNADEQLPPLDAIVIGAGFGGLRMLYQLLREGKSVKVLEAGTDVGGTWYWNRYPGARTDSESWAYCYQFSDELVDDWTWSERLPGQEEVLRYLQHVADRFELRQHIEFSSRVAFAHFDEQAGVWTVETEGGERFRSRYLVSATGVLSVPKQPDFPGLESFKGEHYFAPQWPKDEVDLEGKRVAIIGSAATAIQILPIAAHAAEHVYYFQRTPNYVLPGRNYSIHSAQGKAFKKRRGELFDQRRSHAFGLPMTMSGRTYDSVGDEERERIFEAGWEDGGFHFCFDTFDDIMTDQRSNDAAADFVRRKIRAIVKDPETARKLTPNYTFFAKRPPSGHFYYETFNRPNVTLVDVQADPIQRVTATGIQTGDEHFEVDVIIFAIGFDAGTGPLMSIDLRGRDGASIRKKWEHGPETYMGLMASGFPNMFMIMGPQSAFGNIPTIIESEVDWISKVMARADAEDALAEPTPEAEASWNAQLEMIYNATLLPAGVAVKTWFLGANVEGKPISVMFFFGGVSAFLDAIHEVADNGMPGIEFRTAAREGNLADA
ncbi:NAD(P)/FAD-dependent oxidoreductase [Sphingomonas koreensis]|uniref:NAD(P)/FAD-dependent oxidoreductase n=1 Tax=Sphingomonas koreensis TaxID=93064 RepID=A0A430G1Z9_9SPHN|nr:NAD(P)/FAD-dependent oxidoreductase [Sphingomonas koreensis]RSY82027.1 NAD(P)/FAD-dependent oxidoreductase [Sphingomonas koreensis]